MSYMNIPSIANASGTAAPIKIPDLRFKSNETWIALAASSGLLKLYGALTPLDRV